MRKFHKYRFVTLLAGLIALIYLSSLFHFRIDLTNEKRFTISAPVKNILKSLDGQAEVLLFLKGEIPAGFKKLASSTQELLQEFNEYSNGKIRYRLVNADEQMPGTSRTYSDTLTALGLIPINLKTQLKSGEQSQFIYPAALIYYDHKIEAVQLYSGTQKIITPPELNSSEALLEYQFGNAFYKMLNPVRPIIGYATGNGEPTGANTYDLVENVLRKNYQLYTVNLKNEPVIPDTFKLLMIVKPTLSFTNEEKFKIDQFVMRGGKLLCFIDRLEAESDSLRLKNEVIAYDRNLNIEDLLFRYGVRINPDLLMDLQCDFLPFSVNGKDQFDFLKWNYFPLFESKHNNAITNNLGLVAGKFVNTIDTLDLPGISKTVLLSSSNHSRSISTPALISSAENVNAPESAAFQQKGLIAGVLLEGKFTSLFKNRTTASMLDTLADYGFSFVSENRENNKMIIVSDGDIPLNEIYQNAPLPMGMNAFTVNTQYEYQFANRQFVENAIEYLINASGLMEAKSKDYTLRLLDPKKTTEERSFWQLMNLLLPVVVLISFGFLFQMMRRRNYTSPIKRG